MNRSDRLKNCNRSDRRSDHIEKIDSDQQTKVDLDPINDQPNQVLIDQSLIDQLIFKNTGLLMHCLMLFSNSALVHVISIG